MNIKITVDGDPADVLAALRDAVRQVEDRFFDGSPHSAHFIAEGPVMYAPEVAINVRPSSFSEPKYITGAREQLWDLTESPISRYCPDDYPPEMGYLIEWVTRSTLEANHWRACDAEKHRKEEEEGGGAA
jgi:hypothetical protein